MSSTPSANTSRFRDRFRDPFSGFSHLLGAVLGAIALLLLMVQAHQYGDYIDSIAVAVFGVCMIFMFASSAVYHLAKGSAQKILRLKRIDHMAIFAMIAGTYTPICVGPLRDSFGWTLLLFVWSLALAGILLKTFWISAPRWLSTLIYLKMGWACVFGLSTMQETMPVISFDWLVYGGVAYTLGAVIYALKWPNPWPPNFGFHEIWHLFVLAGAGCHFVTIYYLL